MSKLKPIPEFDSESTEKAFWEENDSSGYLDWPKAKKLAVPDLRPSTTAISIRLPDALLHRIKMTAHKRDIPYQSLIKIWLTEKIGG